MPIRLPFRPRPESSRADLWTSCPSCNELIYNKQLEKNLRVCPRCSHHFRLRVDARLRYLLDADSFDERDAGLESLDPLGFVDLVPYPDKVREQRTKTGIRDAAVWGFGRIGGNQVVVCAMDFAFMGGSMGSVVGEKVTRAAEAALEQRVPYIAISTSGGARMQEGTLALMQLVKTCGAVERLAHAGVPFISVMSDPTTGGVFASFAALGDVNLAEPNALIGFAGARVAAGTTGDELPEGFQRAEFLFRHGFIDQVVPRSELRDRLISMLRHLRPRTERIVPEAGSAAVTGSRAAGNGRRPAAPTDVESDSEVVRG
jgi:acetyl-CoA carboxylase carboxyl transferase subunit beta